MVRAAAGSPPDIGRTTPTRVATARNQDGAETRRSAIVALVRERGDVPTAELAPRFHVSEETIRRDLRRLEDLHSVERSYGVVRAVVGGTFETSLIERSRGHRGEKGRIAAEAARHLGDATTIFLDEGYLPTLVAMSFPQDRPLTVVTASLPAAEALVQLPQVEVIVAGGRLRPRTLGIVDQWAVEMVSGFVIDLAILGATGITHDGWLTVPNPAAGAVKHAALEASTRRLFIGAHYKFGRASFKRFAHLRDFELAITGRELPAARARAYAQLGAPIIRV